MLNVLPGTRACTASDVDFHLGEPRIALVTVNAEPGSTERYLGSRGRSPSLGVLALATLTTLVYILSRFLPCAPPTFHGEIEDSFIQFLHTAFLERVQFGRDFVFNFGPWGFLYGGYHPATHLISVLAWMGLSVVFWWAAWRVARHMTRNQFGAWLWVMAFAAAAGLPIFTLIEARFKALIVLLWLVHFFVEDHPFTATQAWLVVALALASLVKFNVLVETVMILVVIALDDVFAAAVFRGCCYCSGAPSSCSGWPPGSP